MPNRDYQFLDPCTLRECMARDSAHAGIEAGRRRIRAAFSSVTFQPEHTSIHTHAIHCFLQTRPSALCQSPSISLRVLILLLLLRALLRITRVVVRLLLLLLRLLLLRLRPRGRRWRRRLSVLL